VPSGTAKERFMTEQLPVNKVVWHLTDLDGNDWIGKDQYVEADTGRRQEIRASIGDLIKNMLVEGVDGNLSDGAGHAERIGNTMWHLMSEAAAEDALRETELALDEEVSP
jgi:hypothetical protein